MGTSTSTFETHFPFLFKDIPCCEVHILKACRWSWQRKDNSFWNQLSRVWKETHCMEKLYTSSIDLIVPLLLSKSQGAFPIPHCSVLKPKPSFLPQKALCLDSLSKSAYPELEPSCFWELRCLGSRRLCQQVCGPHSFQKPQCEGMSIAKNSFHGGWGRRSIILRVAKTTSNWLFSL